MPLSNARLADLLYGASFEYTENKAKALRRAGRYALVWPQEAAAVVAAGRSLTEFPAVGPWVARQITEWLEDPPELAEPDELRTGFNTFAGAQTVLDDHPEYRQGLRGDLQMHSTYSDGTEPIAGMAKAALELDYDYISITDHSKGLRIAGGMNEERLAGQIKEIDDLNERLAEMDTDFRVLRSIELNFGTDGEVDMEYDVLQQLDICVGSFHSKLRVQADQTDRVMRAVRHPEVQIIGHPQGRMFGVRKGVQADWKAALEEGARYNKAFEINAQPNRQDFSIDMLQVAATYPVMFSIGTDAHSIGELYNVDLSLAAAASAGIPKDRIINYLLLEELLGWVAQSRATARSLAG